MASSQKLAPDAGFDTLRDAFEHAKPLSPSTQKGFRLSASARTYAMVGAGVLAAVSGYFIWRAFSARSENNNENNEE